MGRVVWEPTPKTNAVAIVATQPTREETLEALKPVAKAVGKGVVKVGISIAVIKVTGKIVGEIAVACGVPAPAVPIVKAVANSVVFYMGGKING